MFSYVWKNTLKEVLALYYSRFCNFKFRQDLLIESKKFLLHIFLQKSAIITNDFLIFWKKLIWLPFHHQQCYGICKNVLKRSKFYSFLQLSASVYTLGSQLKIQSIKKCILIGSKQSKNCFYNLNCSCWKKIYFLLKRLFSSAIWNSISIIKHEFGLFWYNRFQNVTFKNIFVIFFVLISDRDRVLGRFKVIDKSIWMMNWNCIDILGK